MGQFERLVPEGWSIDGAVSGFEVAKFNICSRNQVVKVVTDKGKLSTLEVSSTKKQPFEVLSGLRNYIFEQLNQGRDTRN